MKKLIVIGISLVLLGCATSQKTAKERHWEMTIRPSIIPGVGGYFSMGGPDSRAQALEQIIEHYLEEGKT